MQANNNRLTGGIAELETRASAVSLLLLDVDGVLTDGRLYFSNSGEEMKTFHTLDGQGIRFALEAGIGFHSFHLSIMSNAGPPSGEEPPSPPKRLENLTIRLPSGHRFAPNPPPAGISTATPVSVFKSLVAATMAARHRDDAANAPEPIPASAQRLVYKGKIMKEGHKTLGFYGVESGGTIYLVKGSSTGGGGTAGGTGVAAGTTNTAAAAAGDQMSPMARLEAARAVNGGANANAIANDRDLIASVEQMQSLLGSGAGSPFGNMMGQTNANGGGMPDLQQMQQQMQNNPQMMADMMNNPLVQSLMDNPQFM